MLKASEFARTVGGRLMAVVLGVALLGAGIAALVGPALTAEPSQPSNPGLWVMSLTCMACVGVAIFGMGLAAGQSAKHFLIGILVVPLVAGVFIAYYREISEAGPPFGIGALVAGVAWILFAATRTPLEAARLAEARHAHPQGAPADEHH